MYNIRERDCTVDAYRLLNVYADDGGRIAAYNKGTTYRRRRGRVRRGRGRHFGAGGKASQSDQTEEKKDRFEFGGTRPKPIRKKSCNILRLMPIDVITKANLKDTIGDAGSLFERYFVRQPKTFVIIFHRRLNNGLERESVITGLAEMNRDNKANLKHPELAVIVELIKGLTLISIVPQFSQLQMYNLMEIFT
ncbi:hypothetical protein quinque_013200 [Culex quinquefasciatus]